MRPTVLAVALSLATLASGAERGFVREARPARHVLVETGSLTESDRAELAAKGIRLLRPAANGRHIARLTAGASDARILSIEEIGAEAKVHPSARREAAQGHVFANLNIYFHDDVTFDDARQSILAAGGALEDLFEVKFAPMNRVKAKIAPASLNALIADDRVLFISGPRGFEPRTHNVLSASLSSVDKVHNAPYGLTGKGVAVSLFELAEGQASHVEFQGRHQVFATGGGSGDKTHATHVAGTIAAAGLRLDAKGMAPGVTLTQFCVDASSNGCTTDWLVEKDTKLAPRGVVVDNNSWGFVLGWGISGSYPLWNETDAYFGQYDFEYAAPLDELSIEHNILFVHSAGNDGDGQVLSSAGEHRHTGPDSANKVYCYSKDGSGNDCTGNCTPGPPYCETVKHQASLPYDTLSMTAAAKNVIAVGAVDSAKKILNLSSGGPTKDGRVKPDVVARGFNVLSSAPTNAYSTSSGTSMAAPVVSGIAALMTEQYRRVFNNANPKPQELKALIIAGADEIGAPGPDYLYGFGLANAKKAIDLIQPEMINTLTISAKDEVVEIPIAVESPRDVRVVLQWPDPPVILPDKSTAKALVNDLDLTVVTANGTVLRPYVLDPSKPAQNATTGVNTVDNTEVIDILNAATGTYRVRVTGGTITKTQPAVVVTTARHTRPCVDAYEGNIAGNLQATQAISAGFCSPADALDSYELDVTKSGPVSVQLTAGDTPVRVELIGATATPIIVQPYSSGAITSANVVASLASPVRVTVRVTPAAALGLEPSYQLTPQFEVSAGPRRRATRK